MEKELETISRQRVFTLLDYVASYNQKDVSQQLSNLHKEYLDCFRPENFDYYDPRSYEHTSMATFTRLCFAMETQIGYNVSGLDAYRFFQLLEYLKARNQQQATQNTGAIAKHTPPPPARKPNSQYP